MTESCKQKMERNGDGREVRIRERDPESSWWGGVLKAVGLNKLAR